MMVVLVYRQIPDAKFNEKRRCNGMDVMEPNSVLKLEIKHHCCFFRWEWAMGYRQNHHHHHHSPVTYEAMVGVESQTFCLRCSLFPVEQLERRVLLDQRSTSIEMP